MDDGDEVHFSKFMLTFNYFRLQGPSVLPILKTSSLFYRTFTESTQDHQYLAWEFLWEGKAFPIIVKPPVSNHPKCEELMVAYGRFCLQESNHKGSLPRRGPNPTAFWIECIVYYFQITILVITKGY